MWFVALETNMLALAQTAEAARTQFRWWRAVPDGDQGLSGWGGVALVVVQRAMGSGRFGSVPVEWSWRLPHV